MQQTRYISAIPFSSTSSTILRSHWDGVGLWHLIVVRELQWNPQAAVTPPLYGVNPH